MTELGVFQKLLIAKVNVESQPKVLQQLLIVRTNVDSPPSGGIPGGFNIQVDHWLNTE